MERKKSLSTDNNFGNNDEESSSEEEEVGRFGGGLGFGEGEEG